MAEAPPKQPGGNWQNGMPQPGEQTWHAPMAAPAVTPPAQTQAAPALNSQQINPTESDILTEIGGFLGNLFSGAFGQDTQYPGYKWDALEGWVPDQAAKPAAKPSFSVTSDREQNPQPQQNPLPSPGQNNPGDPYSVNWGNSGLPTFAANPGFQGNSGRQ